MEEKEQEIIEKVESKRVKSNSFRARAYYTLRRLLIGFILISIANALFSQLFYTPKIHNLNKKNREIEIKFNLLNSRIDADRRKLAEIKSRDNGVYRSLFGVDSLIIEGSDTPYPSSKYEGLENHLYSPLMNTTWQKVDMLAKGYYASSLSLDELQRLAQNKEDLSAALPAIWPIDRTQLKALYHYGMRMHPIYKTPIFHKGIDLGCNTGTPIYATGDAVVEKSVQGLRNSGYGQEILLDHEYSYKTRYAHLIKRYVQKGDTVKRGQIIGEVGSTGGSTGPHLHYEVLYKGNTVNPINYFDRDMTNEEYTRLMEEMKSVEYEVIEDTENGNQE